MRIMFLFISLPGRNADWACDIQREMKGLSLFASNLEITLYIVLHTEIGLKLVTFWALLS